MSGWWSAACAFGANRLTKAIASGKPANVNCFRMASPSSAQPVSVLRRSWVSVLVSFMGILPSADFIEPFTRGFDLLERFLLQLDRRGPLDRARERAPGDRPVVRALRLLKRLQRGRVLVLPGQPPNQALDRGRVGLARAFDPESFACRGLLGAGDPFTVALDGHDPVLAVANADFPHSSPNRCGLVMASAGSIRFSRIASATSCA